MNKNYIITFSISVIVLFTVGILMLMLMTPQKITVIDTSQEAYKSVDKTEYAYKQTKEISKESLVREYKVSDLSASNFPSYKPGNSDPFTPAADLNNSSNVNNSNNNTTNGNGGTPNPPSSGK